MYYQKKGFPQEDEIVLCTVTSVQYNSVFCSLDEYNALSGMIHISEVSAGRIKNIREFVAEGKKISCKVLRIDKEKGHIDLSLRRVTEGKKRDKNAIIKQEQKAENIVEHLAKELKKDPKKFYVEVAEPILEHYEYLCLAFNDIVEGLFSLEKTSLDQKLAKKIEETVKEKIKPKEVHIEGVFAIATYAENGVKIVSDALVKGRETSKNADLRYLGAGKYKLAVTADDFKKAEKIMKTVIETVEKALKSTPNTEYSFERIEIKK